MTSSDWVSEEDAAEVERIAISLRNEDRSVPISELVERLGISEEEVRTLVTVVRQSRLHIPSESGGSMIGLRHWFIFCVTAVVGYDAYSEWILVLRAQAPLLTNGTLWLEMGWITFVMIYYRRVLSKKFKRFIEGYRPSNSH